MLIVSLKIVQGDGHSCPNRKNTELFILLAMSTRRDIYVLTKFSSDHSTRGRYIASEFPAHASGNSIVYTGSATGFWFALTAPPRRHSPSLRTK